MYACVTNRAASATGHSLEDHLLQAQQHDPARVKEFTALKRVFREGFNWRDLFDYVTRRLEELTEDRCGWFACFLPLPVCSIPSTTNA